MTDTIKDAVERLRNWAKRTEQQNYLDAQSAADLIERLAADAEQARKTSQYWKDEHAAANANIERLTANPADHRYWEGRYRDARLEVLAETAQLAQSMADLWAAEWRKGHKASTHLEGMSDGADEVAQAILALGEKS